MLYVFAIYIILIVALAVYFSLKARNRDDFVMGGRKIPGFALALSERAAGESSWLLLGLTGLAMTEGLSAIWVALGCIMGILFIWWIMADKLRKLSVESGANTIASLFAARFQSHAFSIRMISSLIIIFFFLFYIAAQFSGSGKVLVITFGLNETTGTYISATVIILYTLLGGFVSVVAVDVFQAVLMIASIVVLPVIAVLALSAAGIDIFASLAVASSQINSTVQGLSGTTAWLFVLSGFSWALGYTGQPHLLARMMAIGDRKNVVIARRVASVWTIFAYAGAILVGLTGYMMLSNGIFSEGLGQEIMSDHEKLLPSMITLLVGPLMAGILLSGAVSAMMSTAASQLMVCSFSLSEDIAPHCKIKGKPLLAVKTVWFTRLMIILVASIAIIAGLFMSDTVYGLVSYAWAGIGSSFGPALLLLLFWKPFSAAGVIASLLSGTSSAVIWKIFLAEPTGISERLASFVIAFTCAFIFSLIFPTRIDKLKTT